MHGTSECRRAGGWLGILRSADRLLDTSGRWLRILKFIVARDDLSLVDLLVLALEDCAQQVGKFAASRPSRKRHCREALR